MGTRIRVVVRVRPPKKHETCVLDCNPRAGTTITLPPVGGITDPKPMGFDGVLGPETTQHDAYLQCGIPLVDALMEGKPACLFAYGQTGSGKTFSMVRTPRKHRGTG